MKELTVIKGLVYPDMPDNRQQKADKMIDNIMWHYEESAANKGTQLVFSDIGVAVMSQ